MSSQPPTNNQPSGSSQPSGLPPADDVARRLLAGCVALLPTDTVYGLAVRPEHPDAVARLFAMKGRPQTVNLPVMISSADDVARLGGVVSPAAWLLMQSKFFPGPLTLAVGVSGERRPGWLRGRAEFAVRMPDDEWLLSVLRITGPLLVTSANLHATPTRESVPDIVAGLVSQPDLIIDDGPRATIPSTLVNCSVDPPVVERVGAVSAEQIEEILR